MSKGLGLQRAIDGQVAAIEAIVQPPEGVVRGELPQTLGARGWLSITDQGRYNSCCGCAVDKCLEWDAWVTSRQRVDLSARMSYLAARHWAGIRDNRDGGVSIEAGAMGAHVFGTVEESAYPYWREGETFHGGLPESALSHGNPYKVGAVARARTAAEILERLGSGQGATVIGIAWTTGLHEYRGKDPLTRPPQGWTLGGHALAVCDYETRDRVQYLRIWNSHGRDWGDGGTVLVRADVLDYWLRTDPFGAYTLTALAGFSRRPFRFEGSMP